MTQYYFKRHWDETTGEVLTDSWGTATYFFETDGKGRVSRQIEVYDNGRVLCYDQIHNFDQFGSLSDILIDRVEFADFQISKSEFEMKWIDQS